MAGVLSEEFGLECTLVLGASKPETAPKHVSVKIAMDAGATLNLESKVAYNPVIQRAGKLLAADTGSWQLPYGITTPDSASTEDIEEFLDVGAVQVKNLPPEIQTLVVPFGSGNTAAAILYGLHKYGMPEELERVVLVGVGPDRLLWMTERLSRVGVDLGDLPFELDHMPLHGWFADYGDRMPETADGIEMHPTYEGKVVRFLNGSSLPWWHDRDGTTCFWIVGGSL